MNKERVIMKKMNWIREEEEHDNDNWIELVVGTRLDIWVLCPCFQDPLFRISLNEPRWINDRRRVLMKFWEIKSPWLLQRLKKRMVGESVDISDFGVWMVTRGRAVAARFVGFFYEDDVEYGEELEGRRW